jgi:hypothetical protein
MADIALNSGDFIRPYRSPWGAFHTRTMKCSTGTSTQVIRVGQVVVLDASGSTAFRDCIIPCAVSSATLNPAANTVVGIAAETPSTSNLSTAVGAQPVIPVWDANPAQEFRARTRFGVITSSIVGTIKELGRDSTLNIDVVMLNASSLATPEQLVVITSLLDNPGDSGGAVTFKFTSSGFLAFYR